MGKKVQIYTAEFRAEAIKLVLSQGFSLQGCVFRRHPATDSMVIRPPIP